MLNLANVESINFLGEVSFPGGMEDTEDGGDPVVTALREAEEELAIPSDKVQVWGTLPQLPSRAKGSVTTIPVLGQFDSNFFMDFTTDHFAWCY